MSSFQRKHWTNAKNSHLACKTVNAISSQIDTHRIFFVSLQINTTSVNANWLKKKTVVSRTFFSLPELGENQILWNILWKSIFAKFNKINCGNSFEVRKNLCSFLLQTQARSVLWECIVGRLPFAHLVADHLFYLCSD